MSTLVSYEPFSSLHHFQNEINRLFDRDRDDTPGQWAARPMRVDVREDANQLVIMADLPGMEQKDLHVNVDNGQLTIVGERRVDAQVNRENYHRVERVHGRFVRSFQLPDTMDVENIQAAYKNGVLEVTLPKRAASKPRPIPVRVQ